jgi:hypothetical protein
MSTGQVHLWYNRSAWYRQRAHQSADRAALLPMQSRRQAHERLRQWSTMSRRTKATTIAFD